MTAAEAGQLTTLLLLDVLLGLGVFKVARWLARTTTRPHPVKDATAQGREAGHDYDRNRTVQQRPTLR